MLLWVYILCWILIILIVIITSLVIINYKKLQDCQNSPTTLCYKDWMCYNKDSIPPESVTRDTIIDPNITFNVTTKSLWGYDTDSQKQIGSVVSDCALLTEQTSKSFTYYSKCEKDSAGNPQLKTVNPSTYINLCSTSKPSCASNILEDGTIDKTTCNTDDFFGVGDIFWGACSGPPTDNGILKCDITGKELNSCII